MTSIRFILIVFLPRGRDELTPCWCWALWLCRDYQASLQEVLHPSTVFDLERLPEEEGTQTLKQEPSLWDNSMRALSRENTSNGT